MAEVHIILIYIMSFVGLFATTFFFLGLYNFYRDPPKLNDKIYSVSIILPAYNEEKGIKKTIESALSLNYPKDKLEIIIIDDGSTDRTFEIAKVFESEKDSKVKVLKKPNGGKGTALNLGIENSSNEIIVSMDADTYVHPDSLREMIKYFYNDKVMSVTPSMGVYKPKGILQRIQHIEYYMGVFLRKAFASLNAIHVTPGAFSAYRKVFFEKYGGYREDDITEDLELAMRIQSKGYIIENAEKAIIYTKVPDDFKLLLAQRKRWYTGLVRNFLRYKKLFSFRYGSLGTVVLPTAVITIMLSTILVTYSVFKALSDIRNELIALSSINFRFSGLLELQMYTITNFFFNLFSQPSFLISILFILIIRFYLFFSRRQMSYREGIKLSFFFFISLYFVLFAFWWALSSFYLIFRREVRWR